MTEQEDLVMMRDPNRWPLQFVLPLKKRQAVGWPEFGFLYSGMNAEVKPTVLLGSYLDRDPIRDGEQQYTDLQAILDDGWEVD